RDLVQRSEGDASLIVHARNEGYLRSVNEAVRRGAAEFVVLMNSDALFHAGTLERLEENFRRDTKIGIINPVSTWANWTRIPFPKGENILTLEDRVRAFEPDDLEDIGNASGFFFAVRRRLFD